MVNENGKVILAKVVCCIFINLAITCVDTHKPEIHEETREMQFVKARGATFCIGLDTLRISDRRMDVTFTYNFWIDFWEVTQSDYYRVCGNIPPNNNYVYSEDEEFPVYNVSWFDAVLYCNAISKIEKLDTVYSYRGIKIGPDKSVYELTGLEINYEKGGYRLPTEAEWQYAALLARLNEFISDSVAKKHAWYSKNASGKIHPVATKEPDRLGLFDLAGNVREWTNDWKGPLKMGHIRNPIGASEPNYDLERVIKGGSYDSDLEALQPSYRAATYPIAASSIFPDLGFRCVRGPILNPEHIYCDSTKPETHNAEIKITNILPHLGTRDAKLVFIKKYQNDRRQTLCFIDFAYANPEIYEYTDRISVYHPTISPDGRYVAFSNKGEGAMGEGTIYIRKLTQNLSVVDSIRSDKAFIPRWWIDPVSLDTSIIFTSSAIDNGRELWESSKTYKQKVSNGRPIGSPRCIITDGGFHDGITIDGTFAVSGYSQLRLYNVKKNEHAMLFQSPYNGKPANGSTQACNVSVSPDFSNPYRCLFLDFGSDVPSSLTGGTYGVHQYLFMSDFSGNVLSWYKSPDNIKSWEHTEWSNAGRYAVASGMHTDNICHTVYLIDLIDSTYTQLVAGESVIYPYLWVNEKTCVTSEYLKLDSLGQYFAPSINRCSQDEFMYKMHVFWKHHATAEAIFLGSSVVTAGVNCTAIKSCKAINMGFCAGGIIGTETLINEYILPHCPNIKVIGLDAVPYWLNVPEGDISWRNGISQSMGFRYDKSNDFWTKTPPAGFDKILAEVTNVRLNDAFDSLGTRIVPCINWGGDTPEYHQRDWTVNDSNFIRNFEKIRSIIRELAEKKIHVLIINFPESPAFRNTPNYGWFGPSWENGRKVMQKFKSLADKSEFVHFYDAYQEGNHDYKDDEALNRNHLCYKGATKLGSRLDSILTDIFEGQ